MYTNAIMDKNAHQTAADKMLMQNLQKVISDAEKVLIEQSRLAVKADGVFIHDNRWNWR